MRSQAEAMIHRVSPEGREQARIAHERRRRRNVRTGVRMGSATAAILLVATLIDSEVASLHTAGVIVTLIAVIMACSIVAMLSRDRPVSAEQLGTTSLDALPRHTATWLDRQQPSLPHAAAASIASISLRLGDMAPQLRALDPASPAADAVRRLLATDIPALVGGYQSVPSSMRASARDGGSSPDAQLADGLRVIDEEIGRMTVQLAHGAFDELATQRRFLELKYESGTN